MTLSTEPDGGWPEGMIAPWRNRALGAEAEVKRLEEVHREFVDGLTKALNDAGVPATPSWQAAIDYLAGFEAEVKRLREMVYDLRRRLHEAEDERDTARGELRQARAQIGGAD